jgi:hypothetical protein
MNSTVQNFEYAFTKGKKDILDTNYAEKSTLITMFMSKAIKFPSMLQSMVKTSEFIWDHSGINYELAKSNNLELFQWAKNN